METSPTQLAALLDISISYASMLLSGKRTPNHSLAARIFAATGQKLGPLKDLPDNDIKALARIYAKAA